MTFIPNAEHVAQTAMNTLDPSLSQAYSNIIKFLMAFPKTASALRGKNAPAIGSQDYIMRQAEAFYKAHQPKKPQPPATVPDEMVSLILSSYFGVAENKLETIQSEHQLSMAAENIVGDLLERYLDTVLKNHNWTWCAGALVKAVDFIKPPQASNGAWSLLQVKNRDNSENSSSSAIRLGTEIQKWHRTYSRKPETNWHNFPDEDARRCLSEEGFQRFVNTYLRQLRAS